uniref:Uncharacterized protein n=1 Tax=Cacopsylla melanoneura TaxID=428564 RepID=A0A8D9E5E9_9HEMI
MCVRYRVPKSLLGTTVFTFSLSLSLNLSQVRKLCLLIFCILLCSSSSCLSLFSSLHLLLGLLFILHLLSLFISSLYSGTFFKNLPAPQKDCRLGLRAPKIRAASNADVSADFKLSVGKGRIQMVSA